MPLYGDEESYAPRDMAEEADALLILISSFKARVASIDTKFNLIVGGPEERDRQIALAALDYSKKIMSHMPALLLLEDEIEHADSVYGHACTKVEKKYEEMKTE